ncbi:O-methyltransferase [Oleisolibacter albus]|uniref:O-methyltransferase n=1 Tax=Oleisolibacter albus TaxID=2171757 RepID=UPI000DF2D75E|nr:class I SAM-dependent methyltransferase [Oleisolibacter albus]
MSTLHMPRFRALLERLYAAAAARDGAIMPAIIADARQRGITDDAVLAPALDKAFLAVAPEVGRLLYQLVRLRRPTLVVEFGTSFGLAALHIAAALRDNGSGWLISGEMEPGKVAAARRHLAEAGLEHLVEVRQGDARETLAGIDGIDLLWLDGWKTLYLSLLRQLEPALSPGALVVADNLTLLPEKMAPYLAHVRNPANGYVSTMLPLHDGLELSLRDAAGRC